MKILNLPSALAIPLNTVPYACLTLRNVKSTSGCEAVAKAYDLAFGPGQASGTFLVHSNSRPSGGHKIQAIELFVAALEISRSDGQARCDLRYVDGLGQFLSSATQGPAKSDGVLSLPSSSQPGDVFIDSAVALFLEQSGFPIHVNETQTDLTRVDVASLHKFLLSSEVTQVFKRAA